MRTHSSYFPFFTGKGGTYPPNAFSSSFPTAKQSRSWFVLAITCRPKGKPSSDKPRGTCNTGSFKTFHMEV